MRNTTRPTPLFVRATSRTVAVVIESFESRTLLSVATPTFRMGNPTGTGTVIRPAYSANLFTGSALRKAYGIDTATYNGTTLDGTGQTIAIIDAYNAPSITTDLAAFNSLYGLPGGTLVVRNQTGGTARPPSDPAGAGDSWAVETALDVEWAHAFAPKATILLVLANSSDDADLNVATDYARNYPGVSAISMSYGSDEFYNAADDNSYVDDFHYLTPTGHTGITFFSSSGDNGAYSPDTTNKLVGYPASSPNVVGVGGTKLTTLASGLYGSETGWGSGTSSGSSTGNGGSGGGVSLYAAKPSYQSSITLGGSKRAVPDVSFVADPASGAGVIDSYDNGGSTTPFNVGGTSLSSPLWGGLMALVNQARSIAGLGTMNGLTEMLPKLYSLPAADFHDVTSGNNGYAAGVGYDYVTGRGTPVVQSLITGLVGIASTGPAIGGFTANPPTLVVGAASTTLTASSVSDSSSTISGLNFYGETNGTAGLQLTGSTPDTLLGAGTVSGANYSFTLATGALAIGTYTYYAVATDAAAASVTATTTLKVVSGATSVPVLGFDVSGQTAYGTQGLAADTVAAGLTASRGLTRGAGVTATTGAAGNAWGGTNWKSTSALGLTSDTVVSFGTTVQTGFSLSLSNISLNYRRSPTGAPSGLWQYQLNGGAWVTITDVANEFPISTSGGGSITPIDLSAIGALQNLTVGTAVNVRVVPYGASGSGGTWYVKDGATGDDLIVNGIVSPVSTATAPTIVNAPTATLNAAGTAATLAVLGADAGSAGEASVTYAWSITQKPAGSNATFGVNGTNAAKNSTLNVDLAGAYTLLVTLTGPTGLTKTASVSVNVPLVASGGVFIDDTAPLRATFTLNGNASASLGVEDFTLTDTTTNAAVTIPAAATASFDAATNKATLSFGSTLPSGRYRITMKAAGVNAGSTVPLSADYGFTFNFLDGDVNDNGTVDFADLLVLAKSYGTAASTRSAGDLDFNGSVNFSDLLILAKNYGSSLPAISTSFVPANTFASTKTRKASGGVASDVL